MQNPSDPKTSAPHVSAQALEEAVRAALVAIVQMRIELAVGLLKKIHGGEPSAEEIEREMQESYRWVAGLLPEDNPFRLSLDLFRRGLPGFKEPN